jgi:hypothetical protein
LAMLAEIFADAPVNIGHKCPIRSCTVTMQLVIVNLMIPNALLERYAWSNEFIARRQWDSRYTGTKGLRERLSRSLHKLGRP